jgi:ATP-binding cassette, subfamily B, bacterial CvaB/MchF/RaxB
MNEELHTILGGLLQFSGRGRVPLHLQTETSECGLACLAMVAGFHGSHTDLLTLRERAGLSARGSNLASLIGVAGKMHLAARALSLDLDSLSELRKPCILHWDLNHFVVLVSVKGKRYVVHDPADAGGHPDGDG